ncbi:MAG: orotidine 5'-phosphate decarboxylase [Candidatus Heimdallarchaeota archaeon]
MNFLRLLSTAKADSGSKICVGLDFANYGSRSTQTLAKNQDKVTKILQTIEELSSYCCAFKINRQYILDLYLDQIQQITYTIHERNRPIIIDHKVSDIGFTNDQALYHFSQEGFDAFTYSPFPGNVKEICDKAKRRGLATFVLVLMSNPEAAWMTQWSKGCVPLYQHLARLTNLYAEGAVVGATGHVGDSELKILSQELSDKVILAPGIGQQGGGLSQLLKYFREEVVFNIGRGIIYQKNPLAKLKEYNMEIGKLDP